MPLPLAEAIAEAARLLSDPTQLVRGVLSGRRRNMVAPAERIDIKPVLIKDQILIQVMSNDGRATTTKNYPAGEFPAHELIDSGFANILVETTELEYSLRISKKGEALVSEKRVSRSQELEHDRKKKRLLDPSDPFLKEIGISDKNGEIKPSRQDKFMQVEEFLRLLMPTLSAAIEAGHIAAPTSDEPLEIVDLGCGHAYLTFAAHQYLHKAGMDIHVVGIDIREASRQRNSEIAEKLAITSSIEFRAEEIAATQASQVNVAIALHACDTATDDALAWAVKNGAELILAAPCCHHDMQSQISEIPEPWSIITRQGILKERMVDIMTDAIRAQILRALGYRVEAIEFVGGEHTPRNLMIRAVKTGATLSPEEIDRYRALLAMWKVTPALAQRLNSELVAAGVMG